MKLEKIVIFASLLLLLTACFQPFGALDDKAPDSDQAEFVLDIDIQNQNNRSYFPAVPAISDYRVVMTHDTYATIDTTTAGLPFTQNLTAAPDWQIYVEARDGSSQVLATGNISADIQADQTNSYAINLLPADSATGNVDITILWPAESTWSDSVVDHFSGHLTQMGQADRAISFGSVVTYTVNYSESGLSSGPYRFYAEAQDVTNQKMFSISDVIYIYDYQDTSITIDYGTMIEGDNTKANAPTSLMGWIDNATGNIKFSWNDSSGIEDNYYLERNHNGGPWELVDDMIAADSTAYTDSSVSITPGNGYYVYRLAAKNRLGLSTYDSFILNYYDDVYADPDFVGSNPDGTRERPFNYLQDAVNRADSGGYSLVKAGQGEFNLTASLNMIAGVSVKGGYNDSTWLHDPPANETIISSSIPESSVTASDPDATLIFSGAAFNPTDSLSWCTIYGNISTQTTGAAVQIDYGASPTISNCKIIGGRSGNYRYGIHIHDSAPVIENNHIQGADGAVTLGWVQTILFSSNSATPAIIRNNFILGSNSDVPRIDTINLDNVANAQIYNNTIDTGLGDTGTSSTYGIFLTANSQADIRNNIIYSKSSAATKTAIYETGTASINTLRNNNLFGFNKLLLANGSIDYFEIQSINSIDPGEIPDCSANIVLPLSLSPSNGSPNEIYPYPVAFGGEDLTGSGVLVDIEGNPRIVNMSMGAYEVNSDFNAGNSVLTVNDSGTIADAVYSGVLTLPEAVDLVNSGFYDEIVFDPSVTSIAISGTLNLKKSCTLNGDNDANKIPDITIDGGPDMYTIFDIDDGLPSFNDINLESIRFADANPRFFNNGENLTIDHCVFEGVTSTVTGMIVNESTAGSTVHFNASVCLNNTTSFGTGGLFNGIDNLIIENSLFWNNEITGGSYEGVIAYINAGESLTMSNSTVYSVATNQIPLYFNNNNLTGNIINSIFAEDTVDITKEIYHTGSGTVNVTNCYMAIGEDDTVVTNALGTTPTFIDSSMGYGADGIWFTADDGFMPMYDGPQVNAGTDSGGTILDIRGNVRIPSDKPDIGAYEYPDNTVDAFFDIPMLSDIIDNIDVSAVYSYKEGEIINASFPGGYSDYQWYWNNQSIDGGPTVTSVNFDTSGEKWGWHYLMVIVTDADGKVFSKTQKILIKDPSLI